MEQEKQDELLQLRVSKPFKEALQELADEAAVERAVPVSAKVLLIQSALKGNPQLRRRYMAKRKEAQS